MERVPQPTPKVSRADVLRVATRDFGEALARAVAVLDQYGHEEWEREPHRVQLAVLKLAAGDLKTLTEAIGSAKHDYRDVLAAAEYPKYMRKAFNIETLHPEEQAALIQSDWQQYASWLAKP